MLGGAVMTATLGAQEPGGSLEHRVTEAVSSVVRARVGAAAKVEVTVVRTRLTQPEAAEAGLVAEPPPGARLGRPVRFALFRAEELATGGRRRRVGYVMAEARVEIPHVRAARALSRGQTIGAGDVEVSNTDVGQVPMAPLPRLDTALGLTVARNVRAGELLSSSVVRVTPLVRTGESVVTRVAVGALRVTGVAVARQRGQLGEVIKLVNKESGRRLRGRVVGKGEVEVVP
jgi:flagella basal body P-ring formation protein FlgA